MSKQNIIVRKSNQNDLIEVFCLYEFINLKCASFGH